MLNVNIICLGKLDAAFKAPCDEYIKRLKAFCNLNVIELQEHRVDEKSASQANINAALEKEAARIIKLLPKSGRIACLCIEGEQQTSQQFAATLDSCALDGAGALTFIIGSSHGLAPTIKNMAHIQFSLSKLTLPHQLARLVLLEAVYRAFSISAGTKYHK